MHEGDHDHTGQRQPQAMYGDRGFRRNLAIEESQARQPNGEAKGDLDEGMGVQLDPRESDTRQQDDTAGNGNPAPAGRDIAGKQHGERAIDRGADRGMTAWVANIGMEQGMPA